jgi:hypothetical protein
MILPPLPEFSFFGKNHLNYIRKLDIFPVNSTSRAASQKIIPLSQKEMRGGLSPDSVEISEVAEIIFREAADCFFIEGPSPAMKKYGFSASPARSARDGL